MLTQDKQPGSIHISTQREWVMHQEINRIISKKLKHLRILSGMTLGELGSKMGLSSQQMHNYESGLHKLSASRLYELSLIFGVSLDYFFSETIEYSKDIDYLNKGDDITATSMQQAPKIVNMLKSVLRIQDYALRSSLIKLMHTIADSYGKPQSSDDDADSGSLSIKATNPPSPLENRCVQETKEET